MKKYLNGTAKVNNQANLDTSSSDIHEADVKTLRTILLRYISKIIAFIEE